MFQYRVKVRGRTYLFGGAGMVEGAFVDALLALRVDEFGENIAIGTKKPGENEKRLGELRAGEALTINLYGLTGVWAQTADPADSNIDCMIVPKP